jgi:Protein of unknown function (DUF2917)
MQSILPTTLLTRWLTGCRGQRIRPTPDRSEELPVRKILTTTFSASGRITCTRGTLWITRDGSSEDILLRTGNSFLCEPDSRHVIEALESAAVEIA